MRVSHTARALATHRPIVIKRIVFLERYHETISIRSFKFLFTANFQIFNLRFQRLVLSYI